MKENETIKDYKVRVIIESESGEETEIIKYWTEAYDFKEAVANIENQLEIAGFETD